MAIESVPANGNLNVNVTPVDNGAGGGETDLMTYSLPAGALKKAGDSIDFIGFGTCVNDSGVKTLRFYFGASFMETYAPTANDCKWKFNVTVVRVTATTQTIVISCLITGLLDYWVREDQVVLAGAETLANAITIKCTGKAANAADITQTLARTTILKK